MRQEWYLEAKSWVRVCSIVMECGCYQVLVRHSYLYFFLHLSVCIENHKFIPIHSILIQHQGVYFSSCSFCIPKSSSNSEKAGSRPSRYTFLINPLDCEIFPVHFNPPPNRYPAISAQASTSPIRPPLHAAFVFIQFGLMLVVPMPGYPPCPSEL